jgi:hypothetical protein
MIESVHDTTKEDDMAWGIEDFVIFGTMLAGVALALALVRRRGRRKPYRFAVGVALAGAFLLMWINGAVGIIGSENNDANMLYFGVIAIGFLGAIVARGRPRGMSLAMFMAALAQVSIAAVALLTDWGVTGPISPWDVVVLTAFFTALWLISAWLFRRAARPTNDLRFR